MCLLVYTLTGRITDKIVDAGLTAEVTSGDKNDKQTVVTDAGEVVEVSGCLMDCDYKEADEDVDPVDLLLDEPYYECWDEADQICGAGSSPSKDNDDSSHTGYRESRCWECHGVGMPDEPADHDPAIQYWSWSCARGFPGTDGHGHGINGCEGYNHDNSPAYFGCTIPNCDDQHDGDPLLENHGYDNAPDAFCNACHQKDWSGWPEDVFED